MWKSALEVVRLRDVTSHRELGMLAQYREVKELKVQNDREKVKKDVRDTVLRPWIRNFGDEVFSLAK